MLLSGGLPYDRFAQAQKTRYLSKQAHRLSGHRADQGRDRHPPLRQSSLLKLMAAHLRENGVNDEQIIEMNFESYEFIKMTQMTCISM